MAVGEVGGGGGNHYTFQGGLCFARADPQFGWGLKIAQITFLCR